MKLSILIPSLKSRAKMLESLMWSLMQQNGQGVEILTDVDSGQLSIGEKRNRLVDRATGEYICFIDDDDRVPAYYITELLIAIKSNPDCVGWFGQITFDGMKPKKFEHSIRHTRYWEDNRAYYRPPNHLNTIKSDIVKQYPFPSSNFGEDTDYAMRICKAGVLKKEVFINKPMYYYDYKTKK